jgi:N-glycosylase/DNA lyase
MKELIESVENLINSDIKDLVDKRILEFSEIKRSSIEKIFKELCFCVMTANCGAEKCIEVHEGIGDGFLILSEAQLSERFKDLGYRFPNLRAKYIAEDQNYKRVLENKLKNDGDEHELRDWIAKTMKGIGYKEASHFLRNIGYKNYAIVDFHIIDLLVKHDLYQRPKTLTKKKYLEVETLLKDIASKLNLNLAELDLYLWYLETGKILK